MKGFLRRLVFAAIALSLCALPASAGIIVFSETFEGTTTLPSTLTYDSSPNIAWSIDASQRLFADYNGAGNVTVQAKTVAGFTDPNLVVVYSLDTGIPVGAGYGNYNVGINFGSYNAVFHPGYSGGLMRVDGYNPTNQNMGFTPAAGVLHHMEAAIVKQGSNATVNIMVRGLGTDSLMHDYYYPTFSVPVSNLGTGQFAGRRSGGGIDANDAYFDNFKAEILPEPASLALLSLATLGLIRRRRTA